MPTSKLTFGRGQESGLEAIAGANQLSVNVLVDAKEAIRTRPGVKAWDWFPTTAPGSAAVTGIYVWDNGSTSRVIYVDADRYLYSVGEAGTQTLSVSTDTDTLLHGSLRPQFAGSRLRVAVAGGGEPQTWTGATLYSERLGSDPGGSSVNSPPISTHPAFLAQRMFLNEYGPSGQVQFTDVGETVFATTWNTNSLEAEARPDAALALHENLRELWAFGSQTVQIYVPDDVTKVALVRTLAAGLGSRYAVIPFDGGFAWLDDKRRIVLSDGGGLDFVSTPVLDQTIAGFSDVSDAWGFRCKMGSWDLLVFAFPTEKRMLCYDMVLKKWSEWRSWSDGGWITPAIRSYAYHPGRNEHLVGLADGTIGVLDLDTATEDGELILVVAVTGFDNKGDGSHPKDCSHVGFTVERGLTESSTVAPYVTLAWRDSLTEAMGTPLYLSLGVAGDNVMNVDVRSLGVYRQRQWEVRYSATYPLTLGPVTETHAILED